MGERRMKETWSMMFKFAQNSCSRGKILIIYGKTDMGATKIIDRKTDITWQTFLSIK